MRFLICNFFAQYHNVPLKGPVSQDFDLGLSFIFM